MRTTMNISLPAPLKQWVEKQVAVRGYSTASEYVRDVLRREKEQDFRAAVDAHLIESNESGKATPMTRKDWQKIRQDGAKLARRRSK